MFEGDYRDTERLDLPDGPGDVAAHDRAGKQEGARSVEVGHGAHRRRQVFLADERIVSTEIFSPRMLCRSASLTAPRTAWAICAPPPTTMSRLPKTLSRALVFRQPLSAGM